MWAIDPALKEVTFAALPRTWTTSWGHIRDHHDELVCSAKYVANSRSGYRMSH